MGQRLSETRSRKLCLSSTGLLVATALLASAAGCGSSLGVDDRNSTSVIEADGKPAIRVKCEYVGKTPGDPGRYSNSHDYERIDTDFYRLVFENLTDEEIEIERVDYRLRSGPMTGSRSSDSQSIRRTWGTNVIPPHGSIERANNMVWSKRSRNAMIKKYYFRLSGDGHDRTFSGEVVLEYSR